MAQLLSLVHARSDVFKHANSCVNASHGCCYLVALRWLGRDSQLYAMRYGTVPVAHATGGLKDTVLNFDPFQVDAASDSTPRAVESLRQQVTPAVPALHHVHVIAPR